MPVWSPAVCCSLLNRALADVSEPVTAVPNQPSSVERKANAAPAAAIHVPMLIVWAGIALVDRTWFQRSPMLDIPKWWVYVAIPVGAAIEALLMLLTWRDNDATRLRLYGATALALMRWEPRIRLIRVQLFQGSAPGSYTLDLDCVLVDAARSTDHTRLSIPLRYRSH